MEKTMTQEQKTLAREYLMKEVVKFLAENQDRISEEFKAKYGFEMTTQEKTTENNKEDSDDNGNTGVSAGETDAAPTTKIFPDDSDAAEGKEM